MSNALESVFADLRADVAPDPPVSSDAPISVLALVARWLADGPRVFTGDDRDALDALCRQIDVRKRISATYRPGWARTDPEVPAPPAVAAGVVAVLLANASGVGSPGPDGASNDGWGLKCTNTALKALDQPVSTGEPWSRLDGTLRGVALGVLDRVRTAAAP
jgi:hypothetical protein